MDKDYKFIYNDRTREYSYEDEDVLDIRANLRNVRSLIYIELDKLENLYNQLEEEIAEAKAERDSYDFDSDEYNEADDVYTDLWNKRDAIEDLKSYYEELVELL